MKKNFMTANIDIRYERYQGSIIAKAVKFLLHNDSCLMIIIIFIVIVTQPSALISIIQS